MKFRTVFSFSIIIFLLCGSEVFAVDYSKPWQQQFSINNSYYNKADRTLILNAEHGCGNAKSTKFIFKEFKIDSASHNQEITLELWSDNTAKALCSHQVRLVLSDYPNLIIKKILKIQVKGLNGQITQTFLADFKITKPKKKIEPPFFKRLKK